MKLNSKRKCRCVAHKGDERWHGTSSGHSIHYCRCALCRQYKTQKQNERRDNCSWARYADARSARERNWRSQGVIGMTLEIYDEMVKAQNNTCAICGNVSKGRALIVDHDHTITDRPNFRKLLCQGCNLKVGLFETANVKEICTYLGWGFSPFPQPEQRGNSVRSCHKELSGHQSEWNINSQMVFTTAAIRQNCGNGECK